MTAAMPAVIHVVHACVLCFFVSTLCLKKVSTFELSVTLSNLNRFSKFKGKRGFTGKAHAQFLPSYATAFVVYFIVSNFSQRRRHKLRLNNDPGEVWLYIAVDCLDGLDMRSLMTAAMPAVIHVVHACALCFFLSTPSLKKLCKIVFVRTKSNFHQI